MARLRLPFARTATTFLLRPCTAHRALVVLALLASLLGLLCTPPLAAHAATKTWSTGSSNWSNAANWTGGVPVAGDTVNIINNDGLVRTISYDYIGPAITLSSLTLDLTGGPTTAFDNLSITANNLTTNSLVVGSSGNGLVGQSGGSVTVAGAGNLTLGLNNTGFGEYFLGPSGTLAVGGSEILASSGGALFIQTGGTHTISSALLLGANVGGSGTLSISGGATTAANVYVGGNAALPGGNGTLNISGGTFTSNGALTIYNQPATSVNLSGGVLTTASLNTSGNPARLNWTRGTLHITTNAVDFTTAASDAEGPIPFGNSLTLSSTQVLQVDNWEWLYGVGSSITQNGGSNSTPNLYLGNTSGGGAAAAYNLNAGALTVSGTEYIGYVGILGGTVGSAVFNMAGGTNSPQQMNVGVGNTVNGTGTYNQTGGVTSVTGNVIIGTGSTAVGTVNLSNGAFSAAAIYVGGTSASPAGAGVLTVSGGAIVTSTGALTLYNTTGSALNLSGGTLIIQSLNVSGNPSRFHWTGGTLHLTSEDLDFFNNLNDAHNLFGTSLTINTGQTLILDPGSIENITDNGSSITQNGGSHIVSYIYLGNTVGAGPPAAYTMSGGTLQVSSLNIGNGGPAIFTQTGGQNTVTGVALGLHAGIPGTPTGTYNLGGIGLLSASSDEIVGLDGVGIVNQTGGANTALANLILGLSAGATGTYNLSGGTANVAASLVVGNDVFNQVASGILNVTGGILTVGRTLDITDSPGTLVTLNGGTINAAGLNFNGSSTHFNWISGTLNLTGSVTWDPAAALTSASHAFGSSLTLGANQTLMVTGNENLGNVGPFLLTLNAGSSHTVTSTLTVANGSITLNGGALTVANLNLVNSPTSLVWTTGTLTVNSNVTFDSFASSATTGGSFGSALTLGASQTLNINGNETLGGAGPFTLSLNANSAHSVSGTLTITPNGTLAVNGSFLSYTALQQNGGTISGSLINDSNYIYTNGFFNGQLFNYGTTTINSTQFFFSPANGIQNNGTLIIDTAVAINSGFLANDGTIQLASGQISFLTGAPYFFTGTLTGFGAIDAPNGFTNTASGLISQGNGTITISSSTSVTNSGEIDLASGHLLTIFSSGPFTNNGLINLNGAGLNNNATMALNSATGIIAGTGAIYGTFINNGLLELDTGLLNVFNLTNTFTNNGTVQLNGPTAIITANITNNAAIQGFGRITGAVTNSGTIEAIGGVLTTANTLTNTGTIRITTAGKFLATNFPNNAGLISLVGGIFDTAGQPLDNTGQITGYGVLSTSGLTNDGILTLTGGTSTINGPLTNAATRTLNIKYQPAIFTGNITNNGTIKVTSTTVTYTGTYTGNAYISDPATNIFQNDVTIVPGGSMTGGLGDEFHFTNGIITNNGTFSNGGLLQSSTNITNNGTFTQSGPQQWSQGATFTNNGNATFASNTGSPTTAPLNIAINSGTITLTAPQHLNSISITNGLLDLTTSSAIIVNSTANIPTLIKQAANLGAWNGPTGITSSSAAAAATSTATALAYATGAAYTAATGQTTFAGQSFNPTDTLITYTLAGDANMDGSVTFADFLALQNNYNKPGDWSQGDWNYDGQVTFADFLILQNNYNKTLAGGAASPLLPSLSPQSSVLSTSAAPEPATLSCLLLAAAPLLLRRPRPPHPRRQSPLPASRSVDFICLSQILG